eukprot:c34662_g1_i1 orf=309-572(+)
MAMSKIKQLGGRKTAKNKCSRIEIDIFLISPTVPNTDTASSHTPMQPPPLSINSFRKIKQAAATSESNNPQMRDIAFCFSYLSNPRF